MPIENKSLTAISKNFERGRRSDLGLSPPAFSLAWANAIAIVAVLAYGLFFISAYALPKTRGRVLRANE